MTDVSKSELASVLDKSMDSTFATASPAQLIAIIKDRDDKILELEVKLSKLTKLLQEKDAEIEQLKKSASGAANLDNVLQSSSGPKLVHPTKGRPPRKGRPGSTSHHPGSPVSENTPTEEDEPGAEKEPPQPKRSGSFVSGGVNLFGSLNPASVKLRSTSSLNSMEDKGSKDEKEVKENNRKSREMLANETKLFGTNKVDVSPAGFAANLKPVEKEKLDVKKHENEKLFSEVKPIAAHNKPDEKPVLTSEKPKFGAAKNNPVVESGNKNQEKFENKTFPGKLNNISNIKPSTPELASPTSPTSPTKSTPDKPILSNNPKPLLNNQKHNIGSTSSPKVSASTLPATNSPKSSATTLPGANAEKGASNEEADLMKWIESVIKEQPFSSGDFKSTLKDGVVLCKLANKLRKDGQTIKINPGKFSASFLENITNYLKCANEVFKIPASQSFTAKDLVDGNTMDKVIKNLQCLKKTAGK